MTKICIKCKKEKKLNEFYKQNSTSKNGRGSYCKKCSNKNGYLWAKNNLGKTRESYKKWKKNNPKKYKEHAKKWQKNNLEKCNEYTKKWQKNNFEKVKKGNKEWIKNNKEYHRKYMFNRRKIDIYFKIKCNISGAINTRLKYRLSDKNGKSTFSFLPYTVDDLMKHLESLFELWMNWQNYGFGKGKWVIDHIKPDILFNYKSVEDEEFKKCWALENLQPMEFIENIKKGKSYN